MTDRQAGGMSSFPSGPGWQLNRSGRNPARLLFQLCVLNLTFAHLQTRGEQPPSCKPWGEPGEKKDAGIIVTVTAAGADGHGFPGLSPGQQLP